MKSKNENYALREITPKEMRCGIGPCPALYEVIERTPEEMKCGVGACPAVYELRDNYVVIGKQISSEEARKIPLQNGRTLAERIGNGEVALCIDKRIIDKRKQKVVG